MITMGPATNSSATVEHPVILAKAEKELFEGMNDNHLNMPN